MDLQADLTLADGECLVFGAALTIGILKGSGDCQLSMD